MNILSIIHKTALRRALQVVLAGLLLLAAGAAQAQDVAPEAVSFQGRLTDEEGQLVADGSYAVTFRLYDADGEAVWEEQHEVTTMDGVFSTLLGTEKPLGGLDFAAGYVLGLTIGDGPELTPRTPLTAVPFSLQAASLAEGALAAGPNITITQQADGSYLISATGGGEPMPVVTDATLDGDGTAGDPLGVADGAVTGMKLADGALAAGSNVTITRQGDGSLEIAATGDVGVSEVATDATLDGDGTAGDPLSLADGAVNSAKVADNTLGKDDLATNAVAADELADDAVDTAALQNGAVTGAKLDGDAIQAGTNVTVTRDGSGNFEISASGEVGLAEVATDATLSGDGTAGDPLGVADGAVTGPKIAAGAIQAGSANVTITRDGGDNVVIAVAEGGGGLNAVATDATLGGDGTPGDPLTLADGAVSSDKLSDSAVATDALQDEAVTGTKLADGALTEGTNITITRQGDGSLEIAASGDVGLAEVATDATLDGDGTAGDPLGLADGAVSSSKLADAAVETDAIQDGAVTGAKLADGALTEGTNITITRQGDGSLEIAASGDVGLAEVATDATLGGDGTPGDPLTLADGAVSSDKMADSAVATDALQDAAVTGAKLDADVIQGGTNVTVTRDGSGNFEISASGEVGLAEVATDATLDGDGTAGDPLSLADGAVNSAKVADNTLGKDDLATNAVAADELADDAVDTAALQNGAVTGAKLDGDAIQAGTNVTVTRDGSDNVIISASGSGGLTLPYVGAANTAINTSLFQITQQGVGNAARLVALGLDGTEFTTPKALTVQSNFQYGVGLFVEEAARGIQVQSARIAGVEVEDATTGVYVGNTSTGVRIRGAETEGILIDNAGFVGMHIQRVGEGDGVRIERVGTLENPTAIYSDDANGVEVNYATGSGVFVGQAETHGLHVASVGNPMKRLDSPLQNGLTIEGAEHNGAFIGYAGTSGLTVRESGGNGVNINMVGGDGVNINSAGNNGVEVTNAEDYGLHVVHSGRAGVRVNMAGNPSDFNNLGTGQAGFYVSGAEGHGVYVGHTDLSGLYVQQAVENGVEVRRADQHGVYVDGADLDGVYVAGAKRHAGHFENFGGGGTSTATLRVRNYAAGSPAAHAGIAAFLQSTGNDATLVLENNGPGDLIKAFSDSGDLEFRVTNNGTVFADGTFNPGGADLAEAFDVEGDLAAYEPGDVLVISTRTDRTMEKSWGAYSPHVAGVYATKPGVLLSEHAIEDRAGQVPLGVVGVIPTKVTLEGGPIRRGDLLVTSSTPGHAMKADAAKLGFGMVLGKALQDYDGTGPARINVLVNVK